jgi:hypothetical protein
MATQVESSRAAGIAASKCAGCSPPQVAHRYFRAKQNLERAVFTMYGNKMANQNFFLQKHKDKQFQLERDGSARSSF